MLVRRVHLGVVENNHGTHSACQPDIQETISVRVRYCGVREARCGCTSVHSSRRTLERSCSRLPAPSGPPRPGARLRQTPTIRPIWRFIPFVPVVRCFLPRPIRARSAWTRPNACELVGHLFVAANPRPQAADPRASVACSQARLRLHVDRRPGYDRQRPSTRRPRRTDLRLGRSAARPPRMQRVINSPCPVSARAKTDGATVTS